MSCPHIPQQNGVAERKHRHLVQCALALLSQSKLPMSYWSYAISTVAHLINKLPTPNLGNQSPWETLYKVSPGLNHLRTFGCECFPLLTPYNSHKLLPKTTPCVFIGYPLHTKGYYCLDRITHQLYTSRHVLFNETIFPGLSHPKVYSPTILASSPSVDSWLNTLLLQYSCSHNLMVSSPPSHESSQISTGQCPITIVFVPAFVTDLSSPYIRSTETHTSTLTSMPLPTGLIDLPSPITAIPISSSEISIPTTTMPASSTIVPLFNTAATPVIEPISTDIPLPNPISHPMQTRSKSGIFKPKLTYTALVDYTVTEPLPTSGF